MLRNRAECVVGIKCVCVHEILIIIYMFKDNTLISGVSPHNAELMSYFLANGCLVHGRAHTHSHVMGRLDTPVTITACLWNPTQPHDNWYMPHTYAFPETPIKDSNMPLKGPKTLKLIFTVSHVDCCLSDTCPLCRTDHIAFMGGFLYSTLRCASWGIKSRHMP